MLLRKSLEWLLRGREGCPSQPGWAFPATAAELIGRYAQRQGTMDRLFLLNGLLASGFWVFHVSGGLHRTPELRLLPFNPDIVEAFEPGTGNRTFFIETNPVWHHGSVSARTLSSVRRYNLIGFRGMLGGLFSGEDIVAAYIDPSGESDVPSRPHGLVRLRGIRALGVNGSLAVFVDGHSVGRISLKTDQRVDADIGLTEALAPRGPLQVLLAFYPEHRTSLAPRPVFSPAFVFVKVTLSRVKNSSLAH